METPKSVSYSRQVYVEGVNILTAGVFKQQKRVARPDAHPIAHSVSCFAKVLQTGDLVQTVITEAQPEYGPGLAIASAGEVNRPAVPRRPRIACPEVHAQVSPFSRSQVIDLQVVAVIGIGGDVVPVG